MILDIILSVSELLVKKDPTLRNQLDFFGLFAFMFVCFLLVKKKEMPEYIHIAGSITMPYPLDLVYLWNSLWLFRNFTVKSIGCYRDTSRRSIPGYDGKNILIKDYYRRRADAILKCALVALRFGYRAFAVQHQGWCATGPRAHVTYRKYGRSNRCRNGKGGPWANDVYIISGKADVCEAEHPS